jgi:hypothetical protein
VADPQDLAFDPVAENSDRGRTELIEVFPDARLPLQLAAKVFTKRNAQ